MNGTVIDIPGITVDVIPISLEHSTDTAQLIEIKDQKGNSVKVYVGFGNINHIESKVK